MYAVEMKVGPTSIAIKVGTRKVLKWLQWAGYPVQFTKDEWETPYVFGRRCVLLED